jgi:hypothetical protein
VYVQVVIASMRQLIRLKEGRTAKVKDIPGFLTQCIASKVGNPVYCQQGGQPDAYPYSPTRKYYTVKKLFKIPVQTLPWAGIIKLFPPKGELESDIPAGDEKLFLRCNGVSLIIPSCALCSLHSIFSTY